ncbi:BrxA family protein [Heliophilum fasciatum]|uniref:Putative inner membrane protein DUF1819 n=1 Tax=Heliophilum fasciatum TaxID=35700 RepID=A0A4V2SX76_9FIRM|nr:BrxA family protein [Heliophilum fasciatum]MCW2277574.1 DNA replication protein DnaC [Heliophilum fasciatum]TCP65136.1 putative inner membrane protein DUF1819 [Heliophilum fasciatum]
MNTNRELTKYSLSFIGDGLFHQESVTVARLYLETANWAEFYQHIPKDNCLQVRTMRFGMIVDHEWGKRRSNKLKKLIRTAAFRCPNACMEDIEYHEDRKLNKSQLLQFSTCRYIHDGHHLIIEGPSGNGKTFLACALGNAACRNFMTVRYDDFRNCSTTLLLQEVRAHIKRS